MTSREKYEAIKNVEAEFKARMDALRKEYRAIVNDVLAKAEQRRIAEVRQRLYQ